MSGRIDRDSAAKAAMATRGKIHFGGYSYGIPDAVGSDGYRSACGTRNADGPASEYRRNLDEVTCLPCLKVKHRQGLDMAREARARLKELAENTL